MYKNEQKYIQQKTNNSKKNFAVAKTKKFYRIDNETEELGINFSKNSPPQYSSIREKCNR